MSSIYIKCTLVGDGGIGKTCIGISFVENKFPTVHVPTVFNTISKDVKFNNINYTLDIFDTAGQEEFDFLRPLSYPQTDVFLVCFSVSNPGSFKNVKEKMGA